MIFCISSKFAETCFVNPFSLRNLNDLQWQDLLRLLRYNDMIATLAAIVDECDVQINSSYAQKHLQAASTYARRQEQQVLHEAYLLNSDLNEINVAPIFLKGAAYALAKDKNAFGRLMSDIDILVNKSSLPYVEKQLKKCGWHEKEISNYDDRYYRQWSHELPPFYHQRTGATLDVHHTLIPPITGKQLPVSDIVKKAKYADDLGYLCIEWRLIHCIIHFFYNEDYDKPFRDFWDIKCLVDKACKEERIESACSIAKEHGFKDELAFSLYLLEIKYNKPYYSNLALTLNISSWQKLFVKNILIHVVVLRHNLIDSKITKVCSFIMVVRGHLKKMPLKILLPHTCVKLWRMIVGSLLGQHHFD
ncbi:nucleotidyltransferase family protein [Alteromonas hispanica]|uniref:Nucleotidyltransferase family protein n=1 Tax=Alteromonas hispanica TaxID=315421 RepID=A0A6L9MTV2_9ALTE|nr:nucleotidyltransferase family protein [Alteromonas hispanica]NDW21586.1 hypothetical protein [Alteromonas hispanica]